MPFDLPLPKRLKAQGWKVKILEKERVEPPHVTVFHRTRKWRIGLRDLLFLVPPGGTWREIDAEVRAILTDPLHLTALRTAWDLKYPENPISSEEPP